MRNRPTMMYEPIRIDRRGQTGAISCFRILNPSKPATEAFASLRPAFAGRLNAAQLNQLDAAMSQLDFPLAMRILEAARP